MQQSFQSKKYPLSDQKEKYTRHKEKYPLFTLDNPANFALSNYKKQYDGKRINSRMERFN
jgi:hypothetical protein